MKIKVHRTPTIEAARSAADLVSQALENFKAFPILFLSSGGSSLDWLDKIVIPAGVDLTVGLTDDRFSRDPTVSNWLQLETHSQFMTAMERCHGSFLSTLPAEGESVLAVAERYDAALKAWRNAHPEGKIIATLGVGPDGHTIGILPFPEDPVYFHNLFELGDNWVVGYDVGAKSPYRERITITAPVLSQIDYAITCALGENKKGALQQAIAAKVDPAEIPAVWLALPKQVELFTDQEIISN
jgi:6-phosphogluconolactonase/glucosamine-6-phosphate isomerase/deaminase